MPNSNLNKALSIAAILIAAGTLGYSIYEHRQTVKSQNIQTERAVKLEIEKDKPHLQIVFRKIDSEKQKGFVLSNKGAGTAKIESFRYFLNREDLLRSRSKLNWLNKKNMPTFITDPNEKIFFEELNILKKGYVMSSGREDDLYLVGDTKYKFYNTQARKDMDNIIIMIEYKSLNPFDSSIYSLRYCENYNTPNIHSSRKESYHTLP